MGKDSMHIDFDRVVWWIERSVWWAARALRWVATTAGEHAAALIAGLALVVAGAVALRRRPARDRRRSFTPADRRILMARAGGRCEHVGRMGWRCRARAAHADHVYPYSRGGPTVLSNGAALCAYHNLRKSDRIPPPWYVHRIEQSRRSYSPPGVDPTVRWS